MYIINIEWFAYDAGIPYGYQFLPQLFHFISISLLMARGNLVEDGPGAWSPVTQEGDLDEAFGSWQQSGPALAFTAIWGGI